MIAAPHPIVAFAAERLGFALFPRQAAILSELYAESIRTGVLRLGRRSGKGRIAAIAAVFEATVNADAHLAAVPAGESVAIAVIGSRRDQARRVHGFIRSFLRRLVDRGELAPFRDTQDEIELANGMRILTLPCHAGGVRGDAVAVAILDELAWWTGVDGSPLDPKEIWDGIVPATAQFPQGKVLILSTPRFPVGLFAELVEQAESGAFANMRTWHATTAELNPTIGLAFLEQERARDPGYFAREYEAQFGEGLGAVFSASLIGDAIRDVVDLAPVAGNVYVIAIDPAATGDRWTAIVGHIEKDRTIVDRIRSWGGSKASPVSIDATLQELADMSVAYLGARVITDQWAAEPIMQGLRRLGVSIEARPWTNDSKIDAVASVRRALYAKALEIPRHRELITELASIEQRYLPSGRPHIGAPGKSHDDFATALLALVAELNPTRGNVPRSFSYLPPTGEPVTHRGDLTLIGKRYIDRPTPTYSGS